MTNDPNKEQSSPEVKSPEVQKTEVTSHDGEEKASVPEEFKSQGKLDPIEATSIGDPKEPEKAPEKKETKEVVVEKKGISDDERNKKLFGKPEEKGLVKGEGDLAKAQEKFFERFEKAFDSLDEKELKDIDSMVDTKPKLAEKVSENLFDLWSEKIQEGDKDFLKKLASLSSVAPKIADSISAKFWVGEGDKKQFFKGSKDLFDALGYIPEKKESPKQNTSEGHSEGQKETILSLELKISDVAHELGQSLEEFKKTDLYDKFIEESSFFTQKGLKVDEFWKTVKKSVLADVNIEEAKKKGAEDQKKLSKASLSSPSGKGDDKGGGGGGFNSAETEFLDVLGVNKEKVAERIKKNKGD